MTALETLLKETGERLEWNVYGARGNDVRKLREMVEVLKTRLEELCEPCTRQDYSVGALDDVVIELSWQALKRAEEIANGGKGE